MSDPRIHTCPGGWRRLPWALRTDILVTYQIGPPAAMQHLEAMRRAENWYRQAIRATP